MKTYSEAIGTAPVHPTQLYLDGFFPAPFDNTQTEKAKPFIKWAGGKGQLIEQLENLLPKDFAQWQNVTYIEPFVGGGAMLFYLLKHYPNIKKAVVNDINPDLTGCYTTVKEKPAELIASLREIEQQYYGKGSEEEKKQFFMAQRERYNTKLLSDIDNTTLFIFLNRTCFNGLYRVNRKGLYNVPFGRILHPTICDEQTIMADSALLQKVEIMTGDFARTLDAAQDHTLFYFDPPYRPLSDTSNFNSYAKEAFNDAAQIRLKEFCDTIHKCGHKFMLSNSDGFSAECQDAFFDELYASYHISRVWASRIVNSDATKRGKVTEIVVRNFQ